MHVTHNKSTWERGHEYEVAACMGVHWGEKALDRETWKNEVGTWIMRQTSRCCQQRRIDPRGICLDGPPRTDLEPMSQNPAPDHPSQIQETQQETQGYQPGVATSSHVQRDP